MIRELIRDLVYVFLIYSIVFLMLKIGMILEYIIYRIDIQKVRADKIELFLENKHKGEYSAKAPN